MLKPVFAGALSTTAGPLTWTLHQFLWAFRTGTIARGYALENHLEHVFEREAVRFVRGSTTEGRSKPDFLFPGMPSIWTRGFRRPNCPSGCQGVLQGSMAADLGEADRVDTKHLMTLEPSISANQTDEMQTRSVQLVLPEQVHASYTAQQQQWLWTLKEFILHIRQQQA